MPGGDTDSREKEQAAMMQLGNWLGAQQAMEDTFDVLEQEGCSGRPRRRGAAERGDSSGLEGSTERESASGCRGSRQDVAGLSRLTCKSSFTASPCVPAPAHDGDHDRTAVGVAPPHHCSQWG